MATSPVSERSTVAALLLLTFATGLADSLSILVLGHVFVANMTGNVIFLGFWMAPRTSVDLTAVSVALPTFIATTILSGRLSRYFGDRARTWITTVLTAEIGLLVSLSILAGTGVLHYHDNTKLIMIGFLTVTFGLQHSSARQFGIQELSTTVLTSTIVSLGLDSRLAGGTGERQKLRFSVVFTMCAGAFLGATLSRFVIAPVFTLTAAVVAASLLIFRLAPGAPENGVAEDV
ncbi:YoaK family protein [Mycobacterium montefiorense]|uniref:Membrane protein n=1 Tax=Mycobacterium montefiorense TaxID=154654 RepID=A0AA37PM18_9MYCO|nr:YoaK family protein [Mycobacterium montefiorense]GBG37976.1 membrane protein [Mycobacterium montefiorense]GKU33875.1 membrane protein [Mycobacterium montefiorense]GKU41346.1 membrane protein [Mycobacterium montefiorense]GKU46256.1 membrane protein [Mycobacterium montefiorense]GKU52413.1 membrane protein [Mycobacterium montefiorense]